MAMGSPVSRLQQPRAKQAKLANFAANVINLYPVSHSHSIGSHQNKPAAECQDKILKHHGQTRGNQTKNRRHLLRNTKNDQQYQEDTDQLGCQIQNGLQSLSLASIMNYPFQCQLDTPACQDYQDTDRRNQRHRLQYQVNHYLAL